MTKKNRETIHFGRENTFKMIIKNIATYRDGGTKLIETDQGNYFIPAKQTNVIKGDYFKGNAVDVTDLQELGELIKELSHGCEAYHDIKRRHFTSHQKPL